MEDTSFIEQLINLVRNNKLLYDKRDKKYYNMGMKQKVWDEIAYKCGKSEAECKHRWKLLRERYCKELRKAEKPSGSGQAFREPWCYLETLHFLKPSVSIRRSIGLSGLIESTSPQNAFEELLNSDDTASVHSVKKKPKTDVSNIFKNLEESAASIQRAVAEIAKPNEISATMKAIEVLMLDLPKDVCDQFILDIYTKVMALRAEARKNK